MTTTRKALEALLQTDVYAKWAEKHPIDAMKVYRESIGERRPTSGSPFAQALITLFREHPKPPVVDLLSFWQTQGFYMSWGVENGTFTPEEMVRRAKAKGAEWIAVHDIPSNRARRNEIKSQCSAQGVKLAVWRWSTTIAGSKESLFFWDPDAWIENVEHFDWEWGLPDALRAYRPNMPMAIITNFSGCGAERDGSYNADKAKPWIDAGFALHVESYMVNEQGAQPTLSPKNLVWTATTHLRWPEYRVFPTFALYRTKPEYQPIWSTVWPLRKPGMAFYAEEAAQFPFHSWYVLENV